MVEFGMQVTPTVEVGLHRELVAAADEGGLDLIAVQDHPYAPSQLDAMTVIGDLLARTRRLRFFPDVAPLPLRPPGLLAQAAAALDVLSDGRFELGLGAGGYRRGITGIGGPDRSPKEALDALAEGIGLLRALWREPERVVADGKYYPLNTRTGPRPVHDIGIWVGSVGPRSMRLTGRLADGWAAPIPRYLPYQEWAGANKIIDEAARAAGRDPAAVVRIAQLVGTITDSPGDTDTTQGDAPLRGTPDQWAAYFARLATEQPFRTFIFWPEHHDLDQVTRFTDEVVPATRALLD